jgi:hypothetical protein
MGHYLRFSVLICSNLSYISGQNGREGGCMTVSEPILRRKKTVSCNQKIPIHFIVIIIIISSSSSK